MRLLIERIDVAPESISVTPHAAGIRSLVRSWPARRCGRCGWESRSKTVVAADAKQGGVEALSDGAALEPRPGFLRWPAITVC
jgi:hypothetical protein